MPDVSKCPECGESLVAKVEDTVGDHITAEESYRCPIHGCQAYFAYGYYDPAYPIH
jgi:uncharacterized protein with PIN domain